MTNKKGFIAACFSLIFLLSFINIVSAEKNCNDQGMCIETSKFNNKLDYYLYKIKQFFMQMAVSPNPATPGTTVTQTEVLTLDATFCCADFQTSCNNYGSTWTCEWTGPGGAGGCTLPVQACCQCSAIIKCSWTLDENAPAGTWTVVMKGTGYFGKTKTFTRTFTVQSVPSCSNECSPSGNKDCYSSTHYRTCGNYDGDSCLEWSSPAACQSGYTCSGGNCNPPAEVCGNGYCGSGESQSNCCRDCGCSGSQSCISNTCVTPDPCQGVSCPTTQCSGTILRTGGHCVDGTCIYDNVQDCSPNQCANNQCTSNLCQGVSCPNGCSGNILKTSGTCNPATGLCQYTEQDCSPNTCINGQCSNPACTPDGTMKCESNNIYLCSQGSWGLKESCPNGCEPVLIMAAAASTTYKCSGNVNKTCADEPPLYRDACCKQYGMTWSDSESKCIASGSNILWIILGVAFGALVVVLIVLKKRKGGKRR